MLYRAVVPPEVDEPVDPLVPELLFVPAEPLVDGVVAVELPDAPIPELVPEVDESLGAVEAEDEPDGVDTEPVAEPPVEPMPDAVPEALPDAVVPQAASAAVQRRGAMIFNIGTPWFMRIGLGVRIACPAEGKFSQMPVIPVGDRPTAVSGRKTSRVAELGGSLDSVAPEGGSATISPMLRLSWLLLVLFTAGCVAAPMTGVDRFGITDLTSDLGRPCVTFASSARSGERIQVILLPSQRAVGARITEPIKECGFGQEQGFAYKLQLDETLDQVRALIAVRGPVPATMTFRECTTSESLHLTTWLEGHRVWHGYYYLGYDVEPDCRPEETD